MLVFFVETSLATLAQVFRGMQFWETMTMEKCGLSTQAPYRGRLSALRCSTNWSAILAPCTRHATL